MPSLHGQGFNHDPWADNYDRDVRNEAHPIRAGYARALAWTVAKAAIGPDDDVVDLGAGSGNTAALIGPAHSITCVDLSARMLALAGEKLRDRTDVQYVQMDLLDFFDAGEPVCDALVSTYAIHHLTTAEKATLLQKIANGLRPGGRAVFGDLMVRNVAAERDLIAYYLRIGDVETVEGLVEEYFWRIDETLAAIAATDLTLTAIRKFSALSWGILLTKPLGGGTQ